MRRVATPIFTTLGVVLLAISLLAGYATAVIVSDSGFANHTVSALQSPGVQSALSGVITSKVMAQLPPQYQIAQPVVERATSAVLASTEFQNAFRHVVFHAHHAALSEHNNRVVINLARQGAVVATYLSTLDPSLGAKLNPAIKSLAKIGGTNGLLPVIRALKAVRNVAIVAPIVALVFLVLALTVSMNRRRTMRAIGISVAAVGGVFWLLLSLGGWLIPMFLNDPIHEAMPGLWAAFTADLKRDSLILTVMGLILVAISSASLPLPSSAPTVAGLRLWFERSWANTWSRVAIAVFAVLLGILLILNPLALFRGVVFALGAAIIYVATSAVLELGRHDEVQVAGTGAAGAHRVEALDAARWSIAVGVGVVFLILSMKVTLSS